MDWNVVNKMTQYAWHLLQYAPKTCASTFTIKNLLPQWDQISNLWSEVDEIIRLEWNKTKPFLRM